MFTYITKMIYICRVKKNKNTEFMNWNEMKKKAVAHGFVFLKHGSRHDIYVHKETGKVILLERHWSQEVQPGLMKKLKSEIGF